MKGTTITILLAECQTGIMREGGVHYTGIQERICGTRIGNGLEAFTGMRCTPVKILQPFERKAEPCPVAFGLRGPLRDRKEGRVLHRQAVVTHETARIPANEGGCEYPVAGKSGRRGRGDHHRP
jgi:hypothetical protein